MEKKKVDTKEEEAIPISSGSQKETVGTQIRENTSN